MNKTISFGPLRTSVVELRDITKAWPLLLFIAGLI